MSSPPDRSAERGRLEGDFAPIARVRRARNLRRVGLAVLALIVTAAASGQLGPRERTTTAAGEGLRLSLTHPTIVRPGLEVDFDLTLHGDLTADEFVVRVPRDLFDRFGIDRMAPEPREQVAEPDAVRLTFDAQPGRTGVLFTGRVPTQASIGDQGFRLSAGLQESGLLDLDPKVWVLP